MGSQSWLCSQVLVCAPSNSALDEIVQRILVKGLLNAQGRRYKPSLVRLGLNSHPSILSVSLESIADSLVNQKTCKLNSYELDKDAIRQSIIETSKIICSTLSFSGTTIFKRITSFDTIVVDEAAQSTEPSILLPLYKGVQQVFLVGDPSQLPATVISARAGNYGYNLSLFSRIMSIGYPVLKLIIQYRMHPKIREFPSTAFYANSLKDGLNMGKLTKRPWHDTLCFGPLVFYDVRGWEEKAPGSVSFIKEWEAHCVVETYLCLTKLYPQLINWNNFGIISPYKGQVKLLRQKLSDIIGSVDMVQKQVDINTVDGFQGREKDIVILSAVKSIKKNLGFVVDERRLNVGLTRAKSTVIIVGHANSLSRNPTWQSLIFHCIAEGVLFKIPGTKPYATEKEISAHFRYQISKITNSIS